MTRTFFRNEKFFLNTVFFAQCKIIFVRIIFFALSILRYIQYMGTKTVLLLCEKRYSKKYVPKHSHLLFSNSLLSDKIGLYYFLQYLGKVKKNKSLLLVRPSFRARCCVYIKLQVSASKNHLCMACTLRTKET